MLLSVDLGSKREVTAELVVELCSSTASIFTGEEISDVTSDLCELEALMRFFKCVDFFGHLRKRAPILQRERARVCKLL